ncbi:MFS multidrug transporter-like protein [Xylogone sp. PMI_703]|nr:MFS multidrug transporter-like protein [Xylogone sp. PMI_703]
MVHDPEKQEQLQDNDQLSIDRPAQHLTASTPTDYSSEKRDGKSDCSEIADLDETHDSEKEEAEAVVRPPSSSDSIELAEPTDSHPIPCSRSRSSSTHTRQPGIVPRGKRRGLFARFALIAEVERPYEYPNSTKWIITCLVAFAAAAAPMGSAIFFPALPQITQELHTNATITNLNVALYMLSMSIFPLWWSSFSETFGRRSIYIVSFTLFAIWNVVSAVSTSIGMLVVMRILGGGAAASVQAVGAGTISDIWESKERGRAMGIFYLGPLLGPLVAPIVGGVLTEAWGWRSTQWFQTIYGGVVLVLIVSLLPETLSKQVAQANNPNPSSEKTNGQPSLSRVSTRQSVQQKTKKLGAVIKQCVIGPLYVIGYLRFPPILITVYLASVTFGTLYVLNISIQQTFSESPYNFSVIIVGLLYIPNSLGYIVSSIYGGKWNDSIMAREAKAAGRYDASGKLTYLPEDRMRENAWIAAVVYPGALLWYGWTAQKGVMWLVPMIANFFFGLGSMIIFGLVTTMLTELVGKRSSSGVALNNFVRNILSCVGGVVAEPLITAIGNGWLFTGLAVICWVSAFSVVWAMTRYGPKWRPQMDKHFR